MYETIAIEEIDNAMEITRYILKFSPEDYKIAPIKMHVISVLLIKQSQ